MVSEFLVSSLQYKYILTVLIPNERFYSEYFQRIYFWRFFFPCVDYSAVSNYGNTGMQIILCKRRAHNQEDFTMCTCKYNVITFVCTTSYLFPSPLVSCVKVQSFVSSYGLKLHFNPPFSPWWRGIFGRMVS